MKLYVGTQMVSPWFDGVAEVTHIDESEGELEVMITRQGKWKHVETWGIESTLESLENGEYSFRCSICGVAVKTLCHDAVIECLGVAAGQKTQMQGV